MYATHSKLAGWRTSERVAWTKAAPQWKRMGHVALGIAIGLLAGLLIQIAQ